MENTRAMRAGEVTEKGDLFLRADGATEAALVGLKLGKHSADFYRRPVSPEKQYRDLPVGTLIERGDEYLSADGNGKWLPSGAYRGFRVGYALNTRYRRPIPTAPDPKSLLSAILDLRQRYEDAKTAADALKQVRLDLEEAEIATAQKLGNRRVIYGNRLITIHAPDSSNPRSGRVCVEKVEVVE